MFVQSKLRIAAPSWPDSGLCVKAVIGGFLVFAATGVSAQIINCPDPRAPIALVGSTGDGPNAKRVVLCVGTANDPSLPGAVNASGFFFSQGNTSTVSAGPGLILSVAPGSTAAGATEAANGGQLNTLGTSVASALGGASAFDPASGTVRGPSYPVQGRRYGNVGAALTALDTTTSSILTQLASTRFELRELDRARKAGDARNAALAGIPQVITPGAGMIGASVGGTGGSQAVAIGVSKSFSRQRLIGKAAISVGRPTKDVSWNVGGGFEF